MNTRHDNLMMAERHVADARRIVAEQEARIARLRAVGADTLEAEQTLTVFESNLKIFEEHRDKLMRTVHGEQTR